MFMQLLNGNVSVPDESDWLTGLPNLHTFRGLLSRALAVGNATLGVILLDLDRFKTVNNSFGHDVGDQLLQAVADRLKQGLAPGTTLARVGGDEFGILLPALKGPDELEERAMHILDLLSDSLSTSICRDVVLDSSLGVTCVTHPQHLSPEILLRQANMALDLAKQAGGKTYAIFNPDMERRYRSDLELHNRLKNALAEERLELFYQPQIDIESGRVIGAEALLRWYDEQLGQVPPDRFIPVAEATGLIAPISDWVLKKSCAQLAAWQEAGLEWTMAVNLSVQQFRRPDLIANLQRELCRSGALPQRLELEVTETAAMDNLELAGRQLVDLSALGVSIALDDFGTGYSSLAYLKNLPITTLKIDRAFINDLENDHQNRMIVKTIIDLGRGLNMNLVAEGVESEAQLAFLKHHGCHSCQGWLFSPALTSEQLSTQYGSNGC